jgi:hypothetical protein
MSTRCNRVRSTRGQKVRIKFCRHGIFHVEGGTCCYDDETKYDLEVPSRYKHLVKGWEQNNF